MYEGVKYDRMDHIIVQVTYCICQVPSLSSLIRAAPSIKKWSGGLWDYNKRL